MYKVILEREGKVSLYESQNTIDSWGAYSFAKKVLADDRVNGKAEIWENGNLLARESEIYS